jgi:DNA-directed RNA polymerase specialized sigma24 family protein
MRPAQSNSPQRVKFEELFFAHYARLLAWALQLARGNRWEADDLVQELYVQFARSSPDLDQIQRPGDYLFSVLRNLQYARLRRAGRSAIDDLSIVDYDSIEGGLQAVDRSQLLFVRADLHRVCDFVCVRKNSSRTASILILRFFLGYFPSEVMAVTQSSRIAVDKALQAARREARLDLERPGFLSSIEAPRERSTMGDGVHENPSRLFRDLREKIAASCVGECFGREVLRARYTENEPGFAIEELAHLVSCKRCLDEANAILGLPLLDERSPDEVLGRDTPPGPGSSDSGLPGAGSPRLVSRHGRRGKDSDRRQRQMERRIRDIDEHRPQRLLIAVDGDVRASQKVTAELSELHAKLRRDEKPAFVEVLSEQGICLAFMLVPEPDMASGLDRDMSLELSDERSLELAVSFAGETAMIRAGYRDPLLAATVKQELLPKQRTPRPQSARNAQAVPEAASRLFQGAKKLWSKWKPVAMPEMNPLLASALLLGLASVICFLLWMHGAPRMTAEALLLRAESWDNSSAPESPGVIYQKVRISTAKQTIERTIYRDAQGKRRLKPRSLDAKEEQIKLKLAAAGVNWDEPLSAANFRDWHDHHEIERDSIRRTGEHLLTLTTRPAQDALILQETLTVRESDFHPVDRTIALRDAGTIDIAELNYDILPWGAVNDDWFEPTVASSTIHLPQTHPSLAPHLPVPLTEMELDEAELNVRLVLNELGADTDERISLVRQSTGLRVKGIVAQEERKQQIDARLMAIPHVIPSIFTFDELKNEPASTTQITSVRVVSEGGSVPPLEDYLTHRGWNREDAQHLSEQLLDASVSINQDSRAITELLQEFDAGKPLSPAAAKALNELLERRKERLLAAITAQQGLILQIGSTAASVGGNHHDGALADLADQDLDDCKTLLRRDGTSDAAPEILLEKLVAATRQLEILARRVPMYPSGAQTDSASLRRHTQPDDNR